MSTQVDNVAELLPFYVNGTLSRDERAQVDARLDQDPELRAEAAALAGLHKTMHGLDAGHSPGRFGLARLMRDIDREERVVPARRTGAIGLIAAAVAGALAVGTVWMTADRSDTFIQASGGDSAAVLTVAFQPTATEAQISAALLEFGLEIESGPSAIGLYRLTPLDGGDLEAIAARLRDRGTVFESVDLP